MFGSDDDLGFCLVLFDYRRLLCRLFDLALVFSFSFFSFPSGLCIFRVTSSGCIPYRRTLRDLGTG